MSNYVVLYHRDGREYTERVRNVKSYRITDLGMLIFYDSRGDLLSAFKEWIKVEVS